MNVSEGELAHFRIAGILIVRNMNGEDEEQQQGRQGVAGDLDELVESEGETADDEGRTHDIGPFDTARKEVGHIDQQVAGIHPMKKAEDDQYGRQDIDRQVRYDMVVFHKLVFWVN